MNGLDALGTLTMLRTYSKEGETWNQICDRYLDFMRNEYPSQKRNIRIYSHAMKNKLCVPSMRLMQFAGETAHKEHLRGYNCAFLAPIDFKDFGDLCYLLAVGAGVGVSVEKEYVTQLPCIGEGKEERVAIGDSKEDWADSFISLLNNPLIEFDYSLIRPKGVPLSSGGSASGPEPLKEAHKEIRRIIKGKKNIESIDVADIACLIANCIVSGGSRRSALIMLFDSSDEKMLKFKSDNWWNDSPWRGKANISATDIKNTHNVEHVIDLALNSEWGEPGIMLKTKSQGNQGVNPCQPAFAKVFEKTKGLCTFADIDEGSEIWDGKKFVKVLKKWSTGVKPVYEYRTTKGSFVGTDNHPVMCKGSTTEVKYVDSIDYASLPCNDTSAIDPEDVLDGVVFGDGYTHKASNNLPVLIVGKNDQDYFTSEIASLLGRKREGVGKGCVELIHLSKYVRDAIHNFKTYEREIPEEIMRGSVNKIRGFLRGLFTANGCVTAGRVQFKTSCKKQAIQVQELLSLVGISCSLVTNRAKVIKWSNGDYISKKSYNLILYGNSRFFMERIGFLQSYKMEKCIKDSTPQETAKVTSTTYLGEFEVFDITVDSDEHVYWTDNCIVHNCGEVSLRNHSLCNLTEVIVSNCQDEDDFYYACKAASYFGTLQAGLTKFNYLKEDWSTIAKEESLIGVSLTGQAMKPKLMTPEVLQKGANYVNMVNLSIANDIGINPAKRTTCVKPSGSTSAVMGSTSGIHAAYADRVIRRVRVTRATPLGKKLIELYGISNFTPTPDSFGNIINKPTCKHSFIVHEAFGDKDIVLQFPCRFENAIYRESETPTQLLERMKIVYDNWILKGHHEGEETNNVSITVEFKTEDKESLKRWMLDNQDSYRGISLLPYNGGNYPLAPFEEVSEEEFKKYEENFPEINFEELGIKADIQGTSACSGGQCEIS